MELVCRIDADVPASVDGDPARLRQVLGNLAGNAVKFTDRGEVSIGLSIEEETKEGLLLRFEVRDTGKGVPPAALSRIFERFSQADDSTTRRHGGTGLGLTISRHLVEAMGGRMGVESEVDRGSTFWFTARFGRRPRADAAAETGLKRFDGLRALVVDDNATNRLILQHQLESWRFQVDAASGGREALRRLDHETAGGKPFDLVVLDMNMPEINGMELARRIHDRPDWRRAELVMLTSVGDWISPESATEAGLGCVMTKPVRQSDLLDCLTRLFPDQGVADPLRGGEPRTSPKTPSKRPAPSSPISRGVVLVAEDNPVNQQVVHGMLQRLGFRVELAKSGLEALEAFRRGSCGLILMDCQMPEMDGYEATRVIRGLEDEGSGEGAKAEPRRIPIIALTAHSSRGDREACLAAGMDDYVAKPCKLEDLSRTLGRWLPVDQPPDQDPLPTNPPLEDVVIDNDVLESIRALGSVNGNCVLREAVRLYLEQTPSTLERIDDAIRKGDCEAVWRAAHSLKSSSGNLGAARLTRLTRQLEKMGRQKQLDQGLHVLARLREEFANAHRELRLETERSDP